MKNTLIQTNGDPVKAIADFLKTLVEKGFVDEILAPAAQGSGAPTLALFADLNAMDDILPFAPTMGVQASRMISRIAFNDPGSRIACLVRPCEARAAVELIKLQQMQPEKLVFVTVDCPGTCELAAFGKANLDAAAEAKKFAAEAETGFGSGSDAAPLRTACKVCENAAAEWGEIRIHAFGAKTGEALGLEVEDATADRLTGLGIASFDGAKVAGRDAVAAKVKAEKTKARDALFAAFEKESGGLDGLKKTFSTCIKCLNCMENCPICYCKLCIFKSTTFDHPAERYPRWAARKGAQKMPAETLLFHLTRLNHMASSCIGCGICDTACPMGLPVATLFRKVAGSVQGMLEYVPGRSLEDAIPLSKFREDELQTESGAKT